MRHLVHRLLTVARGRLLPPVDVEVGEFLRRLQRGDLGEAGMHVDQDQRVLRQLVAQRPADVVGEVELVARDEALRGAERVELERLEALGQHRLGRLEEGFRRTLGAIPAIGIAEHAVAHPSAEQLMDRHAETFAEDVPAGDLDRRDDRAMDMAAVERDAVEHALGERVDAARILADRKVLEFVHAGLGRLDEAVQRALADAMDARVGMDPDEQPVLPAGADREGLDLGDLHAITLNSCCDRGDDGLNGRARIRLWDRHCPKSGVAVGQAGDGREFRRINQSLSRPPDMLSRSAVM